VSVVSCPEIGT